MSSATSDVSNINTSAVKSKKSKKRNKKAKTEKSPVNGEAKDQDESKLEAEAGEEDDAEEEESSRPPIEPPTPSAHSKFPPVTVNGANGANGITHEGAADTSSPHSRHQSRSQPGGLAHLAKDTIATEAAEEGSDPRLEALTREREALLNEVSEVRRALEDFRKKHDADVTNFQEQLQRAEAERDEKGNQYHSLLGKVNTIKSQLGERLKADAEDLAQARTKIDEIEDQNANLREQNDAREAEVASLAEQVESQSKELSTLRNRTLLSQENFGKEREELLEREAFAEEQFEAAKQAMSEWKILAIEERSIRESTQEKVTDLEEQLAAQRESSERAASERDSQSATVDGLQRALQELQDARKKELREMVENTQSQIESLQKQLKDRETTATETSAELEKAREELERALPFEKQVKEKNLLIGKLTHEAVILSDHLKKTLRYVRKGKPEDTIDKQVITNIIMRFLEIDRADSKKFQVLQVMAGMLSWNEEQREQAGLARPGASNPNLRIPISPWHRSPSTPSLNHADIAFDSNSRKESLAELWSEFLEQEVGTPKGEGSISGSVSASGVTDTGAKAREKLAVDTSKDQPKR